MNMDWALGDARPQLTDTVVIPRLKPAKIIAKGKDNTKTKAKTLTKTLGTRPHQLQDTKYLHKDEFTPTQIQSSLVPQPTCSWTYGYVSIGEPN